MSSQSQVAKSGRNAKQGTNSRSSSPSTHLAMMELKQRILTSLSKLGDRDTHQIALEDLQTITNTLSPEAFPMLLNSIYNTLSDNSTAKPSVKKESLNLLAFVCQSHRELTLPHLTKLITHIVKRLKDSDSGVRDACRDAIGVLSGLYLKNAGEGVSGHVVGLFVKPLYEAMGEQNKLVQAAASSCMAKMIDCAASVDKDGDCGATPFQKLSPRICKLLNGHNFQAKAALLGLVASLSQVGAIAPQSLEPLLQNIHGCLTSTDWATRKAGADALSALAVHSCSLVSAEAADSALTALEACRFDKIKPVRDSVNEALQLWKKIAGKEDDGVSDHQKAPCAGGETRGKVELSDKNVNVMDRSVKSSMRDPVDGSPPAMDSASKIKAGNISDKAVVILKKKPPVLTDKELNPEFFQNLEKGSGELPVEVVVPRRCSSSVNNEEESISNNTESRGRPDHSTNNKSDDLQFDKRCRISDRGIMGRDSRSRALDGQTDSYSRETTGNHVTPAKTDGQPEGSLGNSRGNWLAIQRQLLQLERQQTHLMHMLEDFMGGSHDSIMTLENRVRGLERVVEDMAQDLSMSSARRDGSFSMGFEGSTSNRSLGKYNGFSDYSSSCWGHFGDRYEQYEVTASAARGRNPQWRANTSENWDFTSYGSSKNGQVGSRRAAGGGVGSPKSEHENDKGSSRRGWDKGGGLSRFGEGPSARSVWQASKDEGNLEAIRVAGEDSGLVRTARVAIPELTAEAMGDDNGELERDPIWTSWSIAMDALKVGDMDTVYAEVCSTGDEQLLVKIMERTGPVIDELTNETACEVLHAISQFLPDHNMFDLCFSWIHQLVEIVMEDGGEVMGIPMEMKRVLLLNLNEASTAMEQPEEWEGVSPDQLLLQLASAWGIELQQFDK